MKLPSFVKTVFLWLPLLLPTYLLRFRVGPFPTTVLECILLLLAIAWLVACGKLGVKDARERSRAWHLPAGAWMIAGIASVIVAWLGDTSDISRLLAALGLFRAYFIEPLIIFFIGWDLIRTDEDRERLWRSFSIVTIGLAVWAGVQMTTGWGIPHPWDAWPGRRSTGPFPFPNALALFVTPVAVLAMTRIVGVLDAWKEASRNGGRGVRSTPLQRIGLDILVVVGGVAGILLSESDGGLVAFCAGTFVALLLHKHARKFAIELAIVGVLVMIFAAPIRERVAEVVLFQEWSGKVRLVIWQETRQMLTDTSKPLGIGRPLLGVGLGAYPSAILPYHNATWMEVFQYPHNIFLNLWSEVGVLGILAFGWIVVTWIKTTTHDRRVWSIAVLLAILVHGLVDVPYFKNDLAVMFWMMVLLTTIYEQKKSY